MENINANQLNKPLVDSKRGKFNLGIFLTGIMLVLMGLTGIMPSSLQGIAILGVSALMLFTGEIYLVYPPMLFYGNRLGLFAGISVYRWFTLLFLAITLIKYRGIRTTAKQALVFLLFIIYCLVVIGPLNVRRGIFAVLDMGAILMLINCYLRQEDKLKKFFTVYVICAFVAYFSGTQMEGLQYNSMVSGQYVEMVRNMATFEDPNYMGYFYTGAIFATVGFKLFTPKLRVVIVIALYAILLTSLSVTAIVVNGVLWIFYLGITNNLSIKAILAIVLVAVLGLGLYQYGLDHPDDPVVGALALRIEEKLHEAESGDIGSATSNRSDLAIWHLQYFWEQPVHKMLVGMNAASVLHIDLNGYKMAAHNEYVDWLLNVGIIGAVIMLYYLISTLWNPLRSYRRDNLDQSSLGVVMVKLVFVLYACTLTLYGDYRFMLFMLI